MFGDPLTKATGKLLKSVSGVTEALNAKRKMIEEAEKEIKAASAAVDKAKASLSM